jgi:hypothetical protein
MTYPMTDHDLPYDSSTHILTWLITLILILSLTLTLVLTLFSKGG